MYYKKCTEDDDLGRAWLVLGLGGCSRCMRGSLLAAIVSWVAWLATLWLCSIRVAHLLSFALALAASMLWLAHWGAYVGKRCLVERYARSERQLSRRTWLGMVLRYATVGLAATVLGLDKALGQVMPCGVPSVLLVASPTQECARDLADAFRQAVLALQTQGSTFADFLCAQRSGNCGRRRCRRIAARNPEDIRPEIRLTVDKQGRRLWCVRCFGTVRVICGCV